MIGGWRPWQRWMVARRLGRHARLEGGEPPADLLRRLREDVPASPALMHQPDRPSLAAGERRGASRRWLAAASLAAALTAAVVGLRVWQGHAREESRWLDLASRPGGAAASDSRRERGLARSSPGALLGRSPSAAPASPSLASASRPVAPARPSVPPAPQSFAPAPPSVPPAPPAASASPPVRPPLERPEPERSRRDGLSRQPERSGAMGGVPSGMGANEAAPAPTGRAAGAAPPPPLSMAAPQEEAAEAPAPRPAFGAESKAAAESRAASQAAPAPVPQAPHAAARLGFAAPLRSSFGADTGIDSYRRVRRSLLAEGRLPRAASVRADELANAFDLAGDVPAVGRPELWVEGAPLPAGGATYLVRFEARGWMSRSSSDAVEVEFDPSVVASFRRVGATAHRGGAAALYEIELRPEIAPATIAREVAGRASLDAAGAAVAPQAPAAPPPAAAARPSTAPRKKAASPRPAGEPRDEPQGEAASRPGGAGDRVIATLRVVSRDEGGFRGGAMVAARAVHLDQLHPSWDAASPALRVQGLAVQLAQALTAKDPGPRLREVRVRAQALAAELPDDPKAAELLQLVDRAADLAGVAGGATPHPP
jgi:hypothetical protein